MDREPEKPTSSAQILQPVSIQISIHIKKLQLTVPSPLKVKLMWVRGSKKMESKKKLTIDPKNPSTVFSETMTLATKFHPDPNDPSKFKRKRCYFQLMALTKGQLKPVGILPFNLSEFISFPPNSTMKLTFAKWFDKNASITLSTSSKEVEPNSDVFETESNMTMETISDTFSEWASVATPVIEQATSKVMRSSFLTCEATTLDSNVDTDTRSASFLSNGNTEPSKKAKPYIDFGSRNSARLIHKTEISKESLQIEKLHDELTQNKTLLGDMKAKHRSFELQVKGKDEKIDKLNGFIEEKDLLIISLKKDLQQKQEAQVTMEEQHHNEKYKMKMKTEYLTNKCFQLNCKLDKKDFTPEAKPEKEDLNMLVDIIEKKQKQYCDTEKNQLQDPTDFLFQIFAQYENMQTTIRKLSEQNNELKLDLIETKVKWAEAEGNKEKLEITADTLRNKLGGSINGSQKSRASHTSMNDSFEFGEQQLTRESSSYSSLTSKYLPKFSFWKKSS